jgi:glycosyltransferase involved in cell wall biosynthesis
VDSNIFYKIKDSELLELRNKHNIPSKFILSVGRIEDRKNVFNNLKAFSLISKLYPAVKYCFIGKFEVDEEIIYSYISSLGINRDQIVFKNYVDDATLNLYLNSCEFLVFTSKDEGFGLPVLEAYSVGKWVILSKIQQLAEFKLSAKQIVNYDSPREIADAMVNFLSNKAALKKEFNPKKILEIHSWKNSVDLFLENLQK